MSRVLAASVPHRAVVPQRRPPGYTRRRLAKPARAAAEGTTSTDDASTSMKPSRKGKVFLIGAGPGGIDHLTVRALRLLRACDVVVHDDLGASDASLLDEAPPSASRVHVGKRGGDDRSWTQPDIDALLVKLCDEGKVVARLKGGCPAVFSRARSEMDALTHARCAYELVPGVSSALAAPLRAGFPLTDVNDGRHFCVTSAHDPNKIDFAAFRGIDTCVFLMAGKSLDAVCTRLVSDAGKRGDTPVAVIRDACGRSETIYRGTLETIVEETNGAKLSPCVVVVGSVCSLGDVYDPNAEGVVSLGGDLEPGTIDVGGDNTLIDGAIDDSYADSYIENLTRAIEAKDARIRTLEEELVVSKRAARMLRGRK
jgi:uroporphyrin-III C-methyltransferase